MSCVVGPSWFEEPSGHLVDSVSGKEVPALPGLIPPLPAAAAIQERMQDLRNQWQLLWQLEKDRETSLQELLALAGQFWPGLAKLAGALSNTQQIVLDLEDTAASNPKDIQAKLVAMQVRDPHGVPPSKLPPLCNVQAPAILGRPPALQGRSNA